MCVCVCVCVCVSIENGTPAGYSLEMLRSVRLISFLYKEKQALRHCHTCTVPAFSPPEFTRSLIHKKQIQNLIIKKWIMKSPLADLRYATNVFN